MFCHCDAHYIHKTFMIKHCYIEWLFIKTLPLLRIALCTYTGSIWWCYSIILCNEITCCRLLCFLLAYSGMSLIYPNLWDLILDVWIFHILSNKYKTSLWTFFEFSNICLSPKQDILVSTVGPHLSGPQRSGVFSQLSGLLVGSCDYFCITEILFLNKKFQIP